MTKLRFLLVRATVALDCREAEPSCGELGERAGASPSLPVCMRTPASRATIAKRIMDCAATGERDHVEMRIAGLAEFRESAA
jgi:hypothetical protein